MSDATLIRCSHCGTDNRVPQAAGFDVRSIPTMLVMVNGREVDRIVGAQPKAQIRRASTARSAADRTHHGSERTASRRTPVTGASATGRRRRSLQGCIHGGPVTGVRRLAVRSRPTALLLE